MPHAIIDPDDVFRFAADLNASAETIRIHCTSAASAFERVHDHWRDEKYHRFARDFEETAGRLRSFCDVAADYADFLRRKADLAERYLAR